MSSLDWRFAESVLNEIAAPGIARSTYRLWRKIANMAVRDGLLDRNPIDRNIRLPKCERKPKPILDASELGTWLGGIRESESESVLLMELGGGLRHEEACAMVWENVKPARLGIKDYAAVGIERAIVNVPRKGRELKGTKTADSKRTVLIGEPFASRIMELKAERGPISTYSESFSETYTERDFASPTHVTSKYKALMESLGIRYVCPKNLRSTYATWHGEAGSPDSLVSLSMGHSDGTTKCTHYQQATMRGLAMIADNLESYLADNSEMAFDLGKW